MYYTCLDSPIGPFLLAGTGEALVYTGFGTAKQRRTPRPDWLEDRGALREAVRQLRAYFAGERTDFDLPLAPSGTDFQREVWRALQAIPYGQTRSYAQIARAIGRPAACRAVGAANAANHLPIVIPCHRVIGADGTLTGFSGGVRTKRRLLELEGARVPLQQGALL